MTREEIPEFLKFLGIVLLFAVLGTGAIGLIPRPLLIVGVLVLVVLAVRAYRDRSLA